MLEFNSWLPSPMDNAKSTARPCRRLRFVDLWERTTHTDAEEADEWRRRVVAWRRFRLRGEQRRARTLNYSAVLLDDPDPRRCGNVLKV